MQYAKQILKMGAGFSSLYHEIHYIKVRYIEVWVYDW